MFLVLKDIINNEKGQGVVEYGIILSLVVLVSLVAFEVLGLSVKDLFNEIINETSKAL